MFAKLFLIQSQTYMILFLYNGSKWLKRYHRDNNH